MSVGEDRRNGNDDSWNDDSGGDSGNDCGICWDAAGHGEDFKVTLLSTLGELEFTLMGLETNVENIMKEAGHLVDHSPNQDECVYCLLKDAKDQITQARRITHQKRDE